MNGLQSRWIISLTRHASSTDFSNQRPHQKTLKLKAIERLRHTLEFLVQAQKTLISNIRRNLGRSTSLERLPTMSPTVFAPNGRLDSNLRIYRALPVWKTRTA